MSRLLTVLLLLSLLLESNVYCQTEFFWSDKGLGEGAVNESLFLERLPGDVVDLYLYYTAEQSSISHGLSVDIEEVRGEGVARFVFAETFNFELSVAGIPIDDSWGNVSGDPFEGEWGQTATIADELIDELCCYGTALGITRDYPSVFEFSGYDEEADAFLVGKIQVEITRHGFSRFETSMGSKLIVDESADNGQIGVLYPTFGCVEIDSEFPPICEMQPFKECKLVTPILGDSNLDGEVDLLDIQPFVDAIISGVFVAEADINQDGVVDLLDIQGMLNLLQGRCATAVGDDDLLGDVNCDGCVDILDLAEFDLIINTGAKFCNFKNTDINGDGSVDILDLPALQFLIMDKN